MIGTETPILAVIIPAFKGRHLTRTLDSFVAQTDRRFRVYVGDDASPEDLASIVAPYRDRLDLVYRRFAENLGHDSLVRHWDRTIALGEEPWLWVFSDDDVTSPDCVAAFMSRLPARGDGETLLRFQVTPIGDDDRPVAASTAYPGHQNWKEYARTLLRPETWIILQNVIFPRSVYRVKGGFCDCPLGIGTDYVAWAKFAGRGGLETLPRGMVYYRRHSDSICSGVYFGWSERVRLIQGFRIMLLELRRICVERGEDEAVPKSTQLAFFCRQFRYLSRPLERYEIALAMKVLRELWPRWAGWREALFWWNWMRPNLRRFGWYAHVAAWRRTRSKS